MEFFEKMNFERMLFAPTKILLTSAVCLFGAARTMMSDRFEYCFGIVTKKKIANRLD